MTVAALGWLAVAVLSLGSLYVMSREPNARARRAFEGAKSVPIGEVKDGAWARVTGTAGAVGPAKTSPLSGREGIGYWYAADGVKGRVTKGDCGAFSITDDSGQVIVEGPFLLFGEQHELRSSMPPEHLEFLDEIGATMQRHPAFAETMLRPGDRVSAFGLVFLEPDPASPSAGLRSAPLVPRMRGADRRPVVLGPAAESTRLVWAKS